MASVTEVYQTNAALTASPLVRLLTVYDYALSACGQERLEELSKALRLLTESLDFSYPIAYQLAAIYRWCGELGRKGSFEEAGRLLKELRDAWATAGKRLSAHPLAGGEYGRRQPFQRVHAMI